MTPSPHGPALDRVAMVARALGDLLTEVVFIGGAIAPLLQTDPPFLEARITSDVDAVAATHKYVDSRRLSERLQERGFRQNPAEAEHIHRWRDPNGIPFDLVPTGRHRGGIENRWDALGIETAIDVSLADGVRIRHVTAPVFLAQKWAAHNDRGADDPWGSHDLEDILALLASRPVLVAEVAKAAPELRSYVAAQARDFLSDPHAEDLMAGHLNNAQDPRTTIDRVRQALQDLAKA